MPDKQDARTVALWGYGRYGKRLLEAIHQNWKGRVLVTAVFDSNIGNADERMLDGDIPLLSTEKALLEYENGLFDAILISVAKHWSWCEIRNKVRSLGIPTTTLISKSDFRTIESFENTNVRELPYGFTLHEYHSLYGFYGQLYAWQTPFYLFNSHGNLLIDNWFINFPEFEPAVFNCPMPLDSDASHIVHLEGDYCIISRMWGNNYWHFTYQAIDQITIMEKAGYQGKYILAHPPFAEELLSLLELPLERVVWLDSFEKDTLYRFENICSIAKQYYSYKRSAVPLLDAATIIERNARKNCALPSYPSRLFVKRIGTRRLLDVDDFLEKYGFTTIVPEELSVTEQINYFRNADVVLTPHGANSTNSLYMKPKSVFVETFGKGWVLPSCTETLRLKGIHYFPIVESPIMEDIDGSYGAHYHIDETILEMVVSSAIELASRR